MYGDCQVLSSTTTTMGGENNHHHHVMTTSDLLFTSPVRNPNFNFMSSLPFHPYTSIIPKEESNGGGGLYIRSAGGKDEFEQCMSGGSEPLDGGISGNEQDMAATTPTDLLLQGQFDPLLQQTAAGGDDGLMTPTAGPKKKRYHRHTVRQIQEMEALFKENPHPDDKQRMRLSQELGLKPRQVKFWFQNRRTQMKAQQDRQDNVILRGENDNLKNDNYRLQAMLRSLVCNNCGGVSLMGDVAFDEQQLRLENARLKEELDRLCGIATRYSGRAMPSIGGFPAAPPFIPPSLDLDMNIYSRNFSESAAMSNFPPPPPHDHHQHQMMSVPDQDNNTPQFPVGGGGALVLDEEKSLAMELAISSLDELVKMCQLDEPLWSRRNSSSNGTALDHAQVVLNVEEHARMFPWPPVVKQYNHECSGTRTEATRATALVIMNSLNLVDAFLDANKWMELFPSIVSRARTIQVVTSGVAGHASGSLHLMYGELQVVSPLVPARETLFLRYCHHNAEEGIWVVVDFPADSFLHGSAGTSLLQASSSPLLASTSRYRRRPSGCIIQDMPNGYSRVTWVEHAEIVEEKPVHQIFNRYVSGGMAFGAQRWLAILQRQCERVASLMATNISDLGVIQSPEARKNLMKLAQRMIRTFCVNISTSGGQSWTALSDSAQDPIRITTRKITEPGQPNGVILSAVTTTWLPFPHDQVFHLLKNERRRSQLEALSNGGSLHEVAHIANGSDPGNCISLLRMNVASNSSQNVELMLQESCTDSSGSLIVYTTVEVNYIQLVMSGEDPTCIPLLPLGFAIVPIGPNTTTTTACTGGMADGNGGIGGGVGCLLTVGLQVHASTIPTAKLSLSSVTAINTHLCNAVHQINTALCSTTTGDNNTRNATPAIAIASHNSNNSGSNGNGNNNNDGAFGVASDVAGSCPKPNASAPAAAAAASNQE